MKALLIIAHGSRNEKANEEVRRLTESIGRKAGGVYDRVEHAFLEITEPAALASIAAKLPSPQFVVWQGVCRHHLHQHVQFFWHQMWVALTSMMRLCCMQ